MNTPMHESRAEQKTVSYDLSAVKLQGIVHTRIQFETFCKRIEGVSQSVAVISTSGPSSQTTIRRRASHFGSTRQAAVRAHNAPRAAFLVCHLWIPMFQWSNLSPISCSRKPPEALEAFSVKAPPTLPVAGTTRRPDKITPRHCISRLQCTPVIELVT
ncbi:hypothetical protein P171DRAFT_437265 [Karstenula rhodostoma CBS 690.94]|uniref:Uncharacterized protein n=1 Tax=Karstenula rhodostoma CBS 690.94 TaxID=1392251 RepID=A0A9P4U6J6_9PLEO|nr:hypothetical protein P171DRAFT_437265 [Karstenula rhodostoma CBS 690.94]